MPNTKHLMKLRELHDHLSTITDDLSAANEIDEKTVEGLGQLVTDVSDLVDQAKETNDLSRRPDLLESIRQFESDHPRVKRFLTQMTDFLGIMGI